MAEFQITATTRTEFGKGASRRLRRAGEVPAVLYGHGTDPQHIALPGKETFLMLRHANVLMEITVEGQKERIMALPKQVQRDPITSFVDHIDLLIVKKGEKVSVEVPLTVVGEAERNSLVNIDLTSLLVLAPATNIPAEIEVSIEGLVIGDQILAGDVKLPEGVVYEHDPEAMVLNVAPQPVAEPAPSVADESTAVEGEQDSEDSE
ncbi:50S ribosomal protein L25/general stress protein Ctc [Tessaracoccus antarcticus]|uniref:Large ribosomal subunit protein bL25 n=1 Tax=Tessaracoccus antarcticus TaxID=2479848 RepID=A0A3M0GB41_9ACTN|nr:50S ribosomal protein L25/general stress protein Ctc [Tessaracoccus antarcticus]RMB62181.1 50S ribosomal protein L25/general stress protein Ctc [Tessaracoccus antarcticus]